jgi:plastocyanin
MNTHKTLPTPFAGLLLLAFAGGASPAAEHMVTQKNKAFDKAALSVKAGDKVNFENEDPFVRNVFSLEPSQGSFDLGTYAQGQARGAGVRRRRASSRSNAPCIPR